MTRVVKLVGFIYIYIDSNIVHAYALNSIWSPLTAVTGCTAARSLRILNLTRAFFTGLAFLVPICPMF